MNSLFKSMGKKTAVKSCLQDLNEKCQSSNSEFSNLMQVEKFSIELSNLNPVFTENPSLKLDEHKSILIVSAFIDFSDDKVHDLYNLKKYIGQIKPNYIICTDGGFEIAKALELHPNLIVGDFDSSTNFSKSDVPNGIEIVSVPIEKDFTDMELALDLSVKLSPDVINIVGGIGGRLDHTIANIQNLVHFSNENLEINIFDDKNFMTVQYPGTRKYSSTLGHHFSAFAFTESVTGVTYEGAYYPLKNGALQNTLPLGVSNSFIEDSISVTTKTGILIVVLSKCK